MDRARASIRTVRGMVSSAWQRVGDGLTLEVSIPANSTAWVTVPDLGMEAVKITESASEVWANGASVGRTEGMLGAERSPSGVAFAVGSGTYRFEMTSE